MCDDAITINRVNTNAHILHLNLNLKQTIALINFWKNVNVNFFKKMYTDFQNMYTISYIQCTQLLSLYKILYIQLYNFSTKKKFKKNTHTHNFINLIYVIF